MAFRHTGCSLCKSRLAWFTLIFNSLNLALQYQAYNHRRERALDLRWQPTKWCRRTTELSWYSIECNSPNEGSISSHWPVTNKLIKVYAWSWLQLKHHTVCVVCWCIVHPSLQCGYILLEAIRLHTADTKISHDFAR